MPCPEEITFEHVDALAAMLRSPARHTQRCVEQVKYLASDGQAWTRSLQLRVPDTPALPPHSAVTSMMWGRLGQKRWSTRRWYPVSLGVFKRRRLPDLVVRDCRGVQLSLLTRQQHGEVLARAALGNLLRVMRPGFTLDQLSDETGVLYDGLIQATYDLFTSAGARTAAKPLAGMVAEYVKLNEASGWQEPRRDGFLEWALPFATTTHYLCWVHATPGDVVNFDVTYTTADARDRLEARHGKWKRALLGDYKRVRQQARLEIYHDYGIAPLHNAFSVPGRERGGSYYFTLEPPPNTLLTYLDWQEGDSFARDDGRLDSAAPAVHLHTMEQSHPEHDSAKVIRAYVRSTPRAQKQIAAAALLNLVFIYLAARGRIADASSAADWLLLAPSALLGYLAEQQKHYYAMATRRQRGVLWVYLGIAIATLVTAVFGSPRSSEHWGWLATGLAWLLVASSILLFGFMMPLGNFHQRATKYLTRRRERRTVAKALAAGRSDFAVPRWKYYEWVIRSYGDWLCLFAVTIAIITVGGLAITDWGRTLPPVFGGIAKRTDTSSRGITGRLSANFHVSFP